MWLPPFSNQQWYIESCSCFNSFLFTLPVGESALLLRTHVIKLSPPYLNINCVTWHNHDTKSDISSYSQVPGIRTFTLDGHFLEFWLLQDLILARYQKAHGHINTLVRSLPDMEGTGTSEGHWSSMLIPSLSFDTSTHSGIRRGSGYWNPESTWDGARTCMELCFHRGMQPTYRDKTWRDPEE